MTWEKSDAACRALRPESIFSVPEGVKHLDAEQLALLTETFRSWAVEPGPAQVLRSRGRVLMVYLLLRYTGARLGEVLALDDVRDLDLERGAVRLGRGAGGEADREVVLPAFLARDLARFLDDPAFASLRPHALRLDPGFVRRKFSGQAGRCPLPRDLLNPRVLRNSRAVELLRAGAPWPAVQAILGRAARPGGATLCTYSEPDMQRLMEHFIQDEQRLRTSARNRFACVVQEVAQGDLLCRVRLRTRGGHALEAVITRASRASLRMEPGRQARAVVKATMVKVAAPGGAAGPNRLEGVVRKVERGDGFVEVSAVLDNGVGLCALAPERDLAGLDLAPGAKALFVFDPLAVILAAD